MDASGVYPPRVRPGSTFALSLPTDSGLAADAAGLHVVLVPDQPPVSLPSPGTTAVLGYQMTVGPDGTVAIPRLPPGAYDVLAVGPSAYLPVGKVEIPEPGRRPARPPGVRWTDTPGPTIPPGAYVPRDWLFWWDADERAWQWAPQPPLPDGWKLEMDRRHGWVPTPPSTNAAEALPPGYPPWGGSAQPVEPPPPELMMLPALHPSALPPDETAAGASNTHTIAPLIDGTAAYGSIYRDLQRARRRIYIAIWSLEDDFVIHHGPDGALKLTDFCRSALATHPELEIYLLLWDRTVAQLPGVMEVPGASKLLRLPHKRSFANPADQRRLHLTMHGNPVAGSHHQKFVLCDLTGDEPDLGAPNASLHVLGMNFENSCWDVELHRFPHVYPDTPEPWHDLGVRVQGPIVHQFEEEFRRRWRAAGGAALPPSQFNSSVPGATRAQALIHHEQSPNPSPTKDWYLSRIPRARDFVYMENQYLDDPDVTAALFSTYLEAERAGRPIAAAVVLPWWQDIRLTLFPPWHPIAPWMLYNATHLRVRTAQRFKLKGHPSPYVRPVGGWPEVRVPADPDRAPALANPAAPQGAEILARAPRHFAVRVEGRWVDWKDVEWVEGGVEVYRMMATTGRWPPQPVYVHAKLGIVDDSYVLGSTNISYQSFVTDSEADVAVWGDAEVSQLIERLWPDLLGGAAPADGSVPAWLAAFAAAARANQANADLAARGRRSADPLGLLLPWQPYEY